MPKNHYHSPTPNSDKNRLFHAPKKKEDHIQNVNIEIKIEQPKDDCMSGCFQALVGCFKPK